MSAGQLLAWTVLAAVLIAVGTGRFRTELVAMGGLLLLGLAGVAPAQLVFSGFGHPALATIVTVFFVSQGIINSGALRGLGQSLARRVKNTRGQIIGLAAVSAFLSAFMNNVGAIGLMLPTAVRMAGRSRSSTGSFGLPLAFGTILGGTLTLIGSAPNIIIGSFMLSATGDPFKMFDYTPHGLAMLAVFFLLWLFRRSSGLDLGATDNKEIAASAGGDPSDLDDVFYFSPLGTREKRITLAAIIPPIILSGFGLIHPAFGFGGAVIILFIGGILKVPKDFNCVDLGVVFFLGAMLGIGEILEYTEALALLSQPLTHFAGQLSAFWLILLLAGVTSLLSNAINNVASAVFMAPLAVNVAAGGGVEIAAALMAVAAGANLGLLLPTHQATLLAMSKAPFSTSSFIRFGAVLTVFCILAATAVIYLVWQ